MTEHRNIPLPNGQPGAEQKESSLLERASGAFGFDPFKAAPIKGKLPKREMKRAKLRGDKKKEQQARERAEAEAAAQTEAQTNSQMHAQLQAQIQTLTQAQFVAAQSAQSAQSAQAAQAAQAAHMGHMSQADYAMDPASAHMHSLAGNPNNLPVPAASTELVVEQYTNGIEFSGEKHAIDRQHLRDEGLIVPEGTITALMEEFRIVKREVIRTALEQGTAKSRRVLICSPHPSEGKTFCAVNLAIALAAERDSEVLLVDADFAKPSILSRLGLPKAPGFMDYLAGEADTLEDLVMGTDIPGLWVLPSGSQSNTDTEYLSSGKAIETLDRLTIAAPNRIVIFDSPPALAASPAAELAKHVGQAVLIACADKTGKNALEDACQLLSGCDDLKLLLNAAQFSPSGRKFGSYYGYGG